MLKYATLNEKIYIFLIHLVVVHMIHAERNMQTTVYFYIFRYTAIWLNQYQVPFGHTQYLYPVISCLSFIRIFLYTFYTGSTNSSF